MSTKKITILGMLLAVSLVLSYLESLLPVMIAVPGVKPGLANMVTMLVLYRFGGKSAGLFMTVRVLFSGLLFSGFAGIVYSFAGGVFCIVIMSIFRKCSFFSILGVSMLGAVFHNLGQIFAAWLIMENAHIFYYFPVLCLTGMLSGMAVGYLSAMLIRRFDKWFPERDE
ncbi:MAG: Gx transporter family protein [Bacteroidales bacterium]|nr:Gx transporter family protein [Clostridium sp.]MCM1202703.1 Gx transporter family protein [Bacteroidales bacterium]